MKKMVKTTVCLVLTLALLAGCTVVNVAAVGEVNGEKLPLNQYRYLLTIAQLYMGATDNDSNLMNLCVYDMIAGNYLVSELSDFKKEAGSSENGESLWGKTMGEETVGDALKAKVFDILADLQLTENEAEKRGLELSETEQSTMTSYLNYMKSAAGQLFSSSDAFSKALGEVKMTEKELKNLWTKVLLADRVKQDNIDGVEENFAAMKTYFDENYIRVKHILVMVGQNGIDDMEAAKVRANEVLEKLDAGEDFEQLMKEYSDDKAQDGTLNNAEAGYLFTADSTDYVDGFVKTSAALAIGQYSKTPLAVEGGYSGYHIIKRYELEDDLLVDNANGVKDAIRAELFDSETIDDAFAETMETLRSTATIVKKDGKIKNVKLIDVVVAPAEGENVNIAESDDEIDEEASNDAGDTEQ